MKARIKKKVNPHGGKTLEVKRVKKYPNGRETVEAYPPTGQADESEAEAFGVIIYEQREVEELID